ncbi:MAG: apolipoprotein N-acyltransferase, partial [Planctomycetales bacterium]
QTNDGWFWGSSALDMHLICGVFRAVEMRKPLVVAANTGFSASITPDGIIELQGPRRAAHHLVVRPKIDSRGSLYYMVGDWFAGLCATFCLAMLAVGVTGRWRRDTAEK